MKITSFPSTPTQARALPQDNPSQPSTPQEQVSPGDSTPPPARPPFKWGRAVATVGGVGLVTGLAFSGAGLASGLAGGLVGGIAGGIVVGTLTEKLLGGPTGAGTGIGNGLMSLFMGVVGAGVSAVGSGIYAAAHGNPTLGLGVGIAAGVSLTGALVYSAWKDAHQS